MSRYKNDPLPCETEDEYIAFAKNLIEKKGYKWGEFVEDVLRYYYQNNHNPPRVTTYNKNTHHQRKR